MAQSQDCQLALEALKQREFQLVKMHDVKQMLELLESARSPPCRCMKLLDEDARYGIDER